MTLKMLELLDEIALLKKERDAAYAKWLASGWEVISQRTAAEAVDRAAKELRAQLSATEDALGAVVRERDDARAEVERLKQELYSVRVDLKRATESNAELSRLVADATKRLEAAEWRANAAEASYSDLSDEFELAKSERDAAYALGQRDSQRLPAWARPVMKAAFDYQAAVSRSCATHAEWRLYDALDTIASVPEQYGQCIGASREGTD